MINFANKRSVVLIQSKKGCLNDFGFQYFAIQKHLWTWVHINLARFAPYAPLPIRAMSAQYKFLILHNQNQYFFLIFLPLRIEYFSDFSWLCCKVWSSWNNLWHWCCFQADQIVEEFWTLSNYGHSQVILPQK